MTDVGFGYFMLSPLDIDSRDERVQDVRRLRVTPEGGGLVAEELGMARRWGYRFDLEPRRTADFVEQCRAYSTDPASDFVVRAPVSQAFENGWITVTRDGVIGGLGGVRLDRRLPGDAGWRAALDELLGVRVPLV